MYCSNIAVSFTKDQDPIVLRTYSHRKIRVSDSLESLQSHLFYILVVESLVVKSSVCKLSEVIALCRISEHEEIYVYYYGAYS